MRKLPIMIAASLGVLGLAGSAAWACDWDDGGGYRQSRVYRYSYAPRTYGYYAPASYSAYWDDDDYGYGYGGVAVGVDVGRSRRFHRRSQRTAANINERAGRVREGAVQGSARPERSAAQGAGEGGRGAAGAGAAMGRGMGGGMSRAGGGGRR